MIEITRHPLPIRGLPAALNGCRIAHLTDWHRSFRTPDALLRKAVALTNAEKPDVIVLTGDYITDDPNDIAPCGEIMAGLCAKSGIFAVLGNHDYGTDGPAMIRALEKAGVELLTNRSVRLKNGLQIVGVDDDILGGPNIARAFAGVSETLPTIALCHNPAFAENLTDRNCLILAGHTHGGQIRVPILTAWKIRKIHAKRYLRGWFEMGKARLYVNRGLGNVGFSFRFRSRPEIALFTLTSESKSRISTPSKSSPVFGPNK